MSSKETTDFRLNTNEENIKKQWEIIEKICGDVSFIRESIARMEATPKCPRPGLCVDHVDTLNDHERRLASLEAWRNWLLGGGFAVSLFAWAGWDLLKIWFKK